MSKAKMVRDSDGLLYGIRFDCPGCRFSDGHRAPHVLPVNWLPSGESSESPLVAGRDHWSFNGDFERPVFGPSVLNAPNNRQYVCHSFVGCNGAAPGQIIFLGDCTHALAGQVVELPDVG